VPPFQTAAVVGAGIAGLVCARDLQAAGVEVVVYEKSRGPGGRLASRRQGTRRYDHGAQVLAPDALSGTIAAVTLEPWRPRRADDLSGATVFGVVPRGRMSAATHVLADGLHVSAGVLVRPLAPALRPDAAPRLFTADGRLPDVDRVVVATPAPQAAALLERAAPALAGAASGVVYAPCWSVMVAWDTPLHLPVDLHDTPDDDLAWAVAQSSRPGRKGDADGEAWVLQASPAWSAAHVEDRPEAVAIALLDRFAATVGAAVDLPNPVALTAHRWRYSQPAAPLQAAYLRAGPVVAVGDWCGGVRRSASGPSSPVADAVRSGRAAAAALLS
jgi:renalase